MIKRRGEKRDVLTNRLVKEPTKIQNAKNFCSNDHSADIVL